ncbi:MAG: hypothetical protein JWP67_2399 [Mucilaginibacter sp.]|nr:hypothetical protein [Mucilaginibacter sp.]
MRQIWGVFVTKKNTVCIYNMYLFKQPCVTYNVVNALPNQFLPILNSKKLNFKK